MRAHEGLPHSFILSISEKLNLKMKTYVVGRINVVARAPRGCRFGCWSQNKPERTPDTFRRVYADAIDPYDRLGNVMVGLAPMLVLGLLRACGVM